MTVNDLYFGLRDLAIEYERQSLKGNKQAKLVLPGLAVALKYIAEHKKSAG